MNSSPTPGRKMFVVNDWEAVESAIRDVAESELTDHAVDGPPPSIGELAWAQKTADRIANRAMHHFDGDNLPADKHGLLDLDSYLQQQIEQAVEAERGRIVEAVKGILGFVAPAESPPSDLQPHPVIPPPPHNEGNEILEVREPFLHIGSTAERWYEETHNWTPAQAEANFKRLRDTQKPPPNQPERKPCERCGGSRVVRDGRTFGARDIERPCPSCQPTETEDGPDTPTQADLDRMYFTCGGCGNRVSLGPDSCPFCSTNAGPADTPTEPVPEGEQG